MSLELILLHNQPVRRGSFPCSHFNYICWFCHGNHFHVILIEKKSDTNTTRGVFVLRFVMFNNRENKLRYAHQIKLLRIYCMKLIKMINIWLLFVEYYALTPYSIYPQTASGFSIEMLPTKDTNSKSNTL